MTKGQVTANKKVGHKSMQGLGDDIKARSNFKTQNLWSASDYSFWEIMPIGMSSSSPNKKTQTRENDTSGACNTVFCTPPLDLSMSVK